MFKLPELPYAADALAPLMSADTLNTHHGKHHAAYVKNTNDLLADRAGAPSVLEDVVRMAASGKEQKLFNNAAQAWNHAFFWNCLTPQQAEPTSALRQAIEQAFGSLDDFRAKAKTQGAGHFASGWLWLVADRSGALRLTDLHDADTPITDTSVTPILVCDLWEHAYYLDHKNDRGKFLDGFLNKLANWRFAESQYEAARNGGAGGWSYPG